MINIKSKEYNLSSLFQYDLLRDILLSLAEYQNDIHSEIVALKNKSKYHEMRISNLEEKNEIKIDPSKFNINITNIEQPKAAENSNIIDTSPRDEKQSNEEEIKKDEIKNEDKAEDIKEKEISKNKKEKEIKDNSDDEEDKIPGRKRRKRLSAKFGGLINDSLLANYSNISPQSQKNDGLNLELIAEMMKKIRENTEKINNLESDINKQIEKLLKKTTIQFQKDMKNEILENKSTFTVLDNRINEIIQKSDEHDKLIEELMVKSSNFDIYKMVRDSGDGSVDMSKLLVKSLEERVFKKFEIVDLRYKQEAGEIMRSKKSLENLNIVAEKNNREINDLKEGEIRLKEEIENLKNLVDNDDRKKYEEILEEKENNQNKKIEDLKNELEKRINDMEEQIKNKMLEAKNKPKTEDEDEEINGEKYKYDEEIINTLEKKFGDLRKKTNDLDNSFKLFIKDLDIDEVKKNIKDIKFELEQKLTKESLKELYNLHLNDVDEIGDLREHVSTVNEDVKKNAKNITVLTNKMELVLGNLITLKENKSGPQKQLLDLSKYVEVDKFMDANKKFNRKFEKTFEELDSLRRDLTELQLMDKDFEKKERIDRLEEDIYSRLNESKNNCTKNKNDLLKQIKNLEVQIKALNEEMKQKQDADSWILAKQPMKCFNCASCEAHIKNEQPSEEFISWNKYPPPNKNDNNNRFGRGFSHMLQMMTSDLINNIDYNTNLNNIKEEDINYNKNNLINSSNNISQNNENHKLMTQTKIATIERSSNVIMSKNLKREIGKSSVPKNLGRFKLPKMLDGNKKIKNVELVQNNDEEKNNLNANNESINSSDNDNRSPRIIKITKKHGNQNLSNGYINSPQKIIYKNKNETKPISSKKRNSKIESSDINKNFSQTNPVP